MFSQTKTSDVELLNLIEKDWDSFEQEVKAEVGHLEAEYVLWRNRNFTYGAIALSTLMLLGLTGEEGEGIALITGFAPIWGSIMFIGAFLGLVVFTPLFIRASIKWYKIKREFNSKFNPLVWKKAFAIAGLPAEYKINDSQLEVVNLLNHSELITEPHNRYQVDDMLTSKINSRPLFLAELDVEYQTGSGKNRRVKDIFHGTFITHELPRRLQGKTFVTTDSDRRGYGRRSLWGRILGTEPQIRETMLEWNDFEDKLHVATTDETEARYILTPDFMQELYDWWFQKKERIRLSFIENRVYVLFPDEEIRIGHTTPSLKTGDLKEYVITVLRPVWHTARLMEQIENRFG